MPLVHTAFYRFVPLAEPEAVAARLRVLCGAGSGLLGSILLAAEGINGMLAGEPAAVDAIEHALAHDAVFGGAFAGMAFKRSACATAPFHRMKVHVKREIVPLGIAGVDATRPAGTPVAPADWGAVLRDPDVVLLDNRNSFEFQLGRFRGAVDPGVGHFRDFTGYVRAHADEWKAQGKRVAMYCTGGIRCEKTAAWMAQDLGMDVLQLEGGILHYFAQAPGDAQADWQGECFVFDNRVALDRQLHETATTLEQVYDAGHPAGSAAAARQAFRLARARRLAQP